MKKYIWIYDESTKIEIDDVVFALKDGDEIIYKNKLHVIRGRFYHHEEKWIMLYAYPK